ncbi:hypothetical protein [Pseudonocardia sp. KRD291]|uniref:hypothetical protein n=1 Tax=Pseudonocardia sp. KRD291 TaxID=2792007 RepID=UPI001C4A2555|nr:hypothetical protein [Pseudonocardia sp. KRD291]MBW0101520.1 hypothetical protein [Pseudonocardia sp. KRD291]
MQNLADPELVQWLALIDLTETGLAHTPAELMTELDRRFGEGAMERLAQHATQLRADPFEIVTAAFTDPTEVIATARGTQGEPMPARGDAEVRDAAEYLPDALAYAASVTRRATGAGQPRLTSLTSAIMAEALITAGWPPRRPAADRV